MNNTNKNNRQSSISNIINHNDINPLKNKRQKLDPSNNANREIMPAITTTNTTSILEKNLSDAINTDNLKSRQSITASPIGLNHRPVTSCTHCRQHKVKCDANKKYPEPCTRCKKFDLFCEIDPKFTPKKGSQLQTMRKDIDDLKMKVKHLLANESLLIDLLKQSNSNNNIIISNNIDNNSLSNLVLTKLNRVDSSLISSSNTTTTTSNNNSSRAVSNNIEQNKEAAISNIVQHSATSTPLHSDTSLSPNQINPISKNQPRSPIDKLLTNNSNVSNSQNVQQFPVPQTQSSVQTSKTSTIGTTASNTSISASGTIQNSTGLSTNSVTTPTLSSLVPPIVSETGNIKEFIIEDVHISIERASQLHKLFIDEYLPYLSIMFSTSVVELYSQSKLLFWTVILTACLSDPEPTLYIKLSPLVKQLAVETCCL